MRDVLEVEVRGARLIGTRHTPGDGRPDPHDVGVLLLSPGHMARAGSGDIFPRMGDDLARLGFPVFRFDFPGLGDSFGHPPIWELEYFQFIQGGGNVDFALELVREVTARFGLRGVVVGGLCGASVTALFATDQCPDGILGLVLMDPDFTSFAGGEPIERKRAEEPEAAPSRLGLLGRKLGRPQTWLRFATGENRFRDLLRPVRSILVRVTREALGEHLPSDTNFRLVEACCRVLDRGMPTLFVTARGMLRELYLDQVQRVALRGAPLRQIDRLSIPDTNHVFTAGGASSKLIREVSSWISARWAEEGGR
jgi:pimeloyl-ACP methyl ester carboxylesterase